MHLVARLARALWVLFRICAAYAFQWALVRVFRRGEEVPEWLARRRARLDEKLAKLLLHAMLGLRGVYIKLGQVLSIMGGFLPRPYTKELEQLQDQVPPHPYSALQSTFRKSIGRDPEECFATVDRTPLAAASLGQVHVATTHDGRKVAVKFLYPGIRGVIAVDLRVIKLGLWIWNHVVPVQNFGVVYAALVDLLRRETDYLHEASCMERMAANFAAQADLVFPEVIRELTTKDILTMTFMEGVKITRFDLIEQLGLDRTAIATRLVESFYEQLFVHRLFHADPHPGNFLVQRGDAGAPRIVILDFGAVCEVEENVTEGMIDVLQGFFEQRDDLVLRGFDRIGFVAEDADREMVERTVLIYFQKLLKVQAVTAGAFTRAAREDLEKLIDPELERQELRKLMRSIRYPDGWFYVERAVVLMFWLVGQIDPELDSLQVGFPYVLPLIAKRSEGSVPE